MGKIKYLIKRISTFDYNELFKIINKTSKLSNKSKIYIFFDMIYCTFKYKSGYIDYEVLEMYKLDKNQRKTLLTRGINDRLVRSLNPKEYWNILDDKVLFNDKFKDFLNRDYMKIDGNNLEEFLNFIKNKKEIIVKPIDSTGGFGIEKISLDKENSNDLYSRLFKNKQLLIEEVATQHEKMNKLHPSSINTIRLVTIRNKYGITSIVCGICRMGTNNHVVDNFHSEGICSPLDIEKGTICGKAVNRDEEFFEVHPTTNVKLLNYKIPNFEEAKKLVIDAHNEVKELGLIGWDVCIGKDKPSLIEGNPYPGYDLYRIIETNGYHGGVLPLFNEALNRKK